MVPSGREEIVYMKELWGIAQKLVITFELLNLCVFSVSSWINPLARSHFENRHLICKFSYDSLLTQKNTKVTVLPTKDLGESYMLYIDLLWLQILDKYKEYKRLFLKNA